MNRLGVSEISRNSINLGPDLIVAALAWFAKTVCEQIVERRK